ncbi:MAG: hypothetical protein JRI97_01290 [Deltaproteobacteria bacterium]|nr:hypothetical protein [Deltaproteobacteria bacterium]
MNSTRRKAPWAVVAAVLGAAAATHAMLVSAESSPFSVAASLFETSGGKHSMAIFLDTPPHPGAKVAVFAAG